MFLAYFSFDKTSYYNKTLLVAMKYFLINTGEISQIIIVRNKDKTKTYQVILADAFHPLRNFMKANAMTLFCDKYLHTRAKMLVLQNF